MPYPRLDEMEVLPRDGFAGALAGRVYRPDLGGPAVTAIRAEGVFDITAAFPTMRDLAEQGEPAAALRAAKGERIGSLAELLANTPPASPRPRQAVAARAGRLAGDQGGRRHLRRPRCWSG